MRAQGRSDGKGSFKKRFVVRSGSEAPTKTTRPLACWRALVHQLAVGNILGAEGDAALELHA